MPVSLLVSPKEAEIFSIRQTCLKGADRRDSKRDDPVPTIIENGLFQRQVCWPAENVRAKISNRHNTRRSKLLGLL